MPQNVQMQAIFRDRMVLNCKITRSPTGAADRSIDMLSAVTLQRFSVSLIHSSIAGTRTGSTRRKYKTCEEDKQLASLIAAGTNCVTIVAKAWDLHVDDILEVSPGRHKSPLLDIHAYGT